MIPILSNPGPLVLLGLCGLSAVAVYFVMRQRMPPKLQRFNGRERLPKKQNHHQVYPGYEMAQVAELTEEVASSVEVPAELIRPTDRFDGELGPVQGFEVAGEMEDLEEAMMRRCQRLKLDPQNIKIETVDDYIRLFGRA